MSATKFPLDDIEIRVKLTCTDTIPCHSYVLHLKFHAFAFCNTYYEGWNLWCRFRMFFLVQRCQDEITTPLAVYVESCCWTIFTKFRLRLSLCVQFRFIFIKSRIHDFHKWETIIFINHSVMVSILQFFCNCIEILVHKIFKMLILYLKLEYGLSRIMSRA